MAIPNQRRPGGLAPVRRASTVDLITEALKEAIMNGQLRPGSALRETELSQQLNVSRGPLREALQRLCTEGIAVSRGRRGLAVASMEASDIVEVHFLRKDIALKAIARLHTVDDDIYDQALDSLRQLLHRMNGAVDDEHARQLGDSYHVFHQTLTDLAGSQRLSRFMRTLLVETRLCTYTVYTDYKIHSSLVEEHEDIWKALRRKNFNEVEQLLESHFQNEIEHLTGEPEEDEQLEHSVPHKPQPLDPIDIAW